MKFCDMCDTVIRLYKDDCVYCKKKINSRDGYKMNRIKREYEPVEMSDEEEINRGVLIKQKCDECGNDEMYYKTMQTRSADEGQTIFYECICGYKTKVNS